MLICYLQLDVTKITLMLVLVRQENFTMHQTPFLQKMFCIFKLCT